MFDERNIIGIAKTLAYCREDLQLFGERLNAYFDIRTSELQIEVTIDGTTISAYFSGWASFATNNAFVRAKEENGEEKEISIKEIFASERFTTALTEAIVSRANTKNRFWYSDYKHKIIRALTDSLGDAPSEETIRECLAKEHAEIVYDTI